MECINFQTMTIAALSICMIAIIIWAVRGIKLSDLFVSKGGGISHTKFWSNIGYFSATLAFLYMNYKPVTPDFLPEIWIIYLVGVTSNTALSKFISMKYKSNNTDKDD